MHFVYLDKVGSTQAYAKDHLSLSEGHPLVVIVARQQTLGRGRGEKSWHSPLGNLYATYLFPTSPVLPLQTLPQFFATSLAEVLAPFSPGLKWPNDVLIDGKKVGGILAEVVSFRTATLALVGVGVNLNLQETSAIDQPATSLFLLTGQRQDPLAFTYRLSRQIEADIALFHKEGFAPFQKRFNRHLVWKGEKIAFGKKEGIVKEVGSDGRLALEGGTFVPFDATIRRK